MYLEIVGDGAVVVSDVVEEIQKSMIKHPLFNSTHEGYGVILEELDELWDEVKKREPNIKNMRAEAVQVAAMAMKFRGRKGTAKRGKMPRVSVCVYDG